MLGINEVWKYAAANARFAGGKVLVNFEIIFSMAVEVLLKY